jgi:Tfp pilus assembly protein PilV
MVVELSSKRGASMLDAVVTIFLVGLIGLMFSAIFPTATSCSRQAQEYKTAVASAQRKMEQVRSLKYELLTPTVLYVNGVIDSSTGGSPYAFTTADSPRNGSSGNPGRLKQSQAGDRDRLVDILLAFGRAQRQVDHLRRR